MKLARLTSQFHEPHHPSSANTGGYSEMERRAFSTDVRLRTFNPYMQVPDVGPKSGCMVMNGSPHINGWLMMMSNAGVRARRCVLAARSAESSQPEAIDACDEIHGWADCRQNAVLGNYKFSIATTVSRTAIFNVPFPVHILPIVPNMSQYNPILYPYNSLCLRILTNHASFFAFRTYNQTSILHTHTFLFVR